MDMCVRVLSAAAVVLHCIKNEPVHVANSDGWKLRFFGNYRWADQVRNAAGLQQFRNMVSMIHNKYR